MSADSFSKIYYSMGEVCEIFDVKPSLIRFWEQKFDIIKPHKNKKGNRLFTPKDLENLKLIYHLVKEKGMTLQGAQVALKGKKETLNQDVDIAERLQNIKALLGQLHQILEDTSSEQTVVTHKAEHKKAESTPKQEENILPFIQQSLF